MSEETKPRVIWDFLLDKIKNPYGVAGLMGNLYAESGLKPANLQNSYVKKLGMTDEEYTKAVDDGSYTQDDFVHDSAGYGLAQWTYWSRKKNLWLYVKKSNASIGDLNAQLGFLWEELSQYTAVTSVLFKAENVLDASNAVLLKYERPRNQSVENQKKRAEYGELYYMMFAMTPTDGNTENAQDKPDEELPEKKQISPADFNNETYPIEKYFMTKNRCYKANKRRVPTGIQVHSVGCKGTTRNRWRVWDNPNIKKCANAFVDLNGVMQCLDWDVRPWLSGSGKKGNANDWCVGFEICEPTTKNDTPIAAAYLYGCVRWLCTQLCREFGIHPSQIKCHSELHKDGVASNHADVNHWWGKKNTSWEQYTMNRLRNDVAEALGIDMNDPIVNPEAVVRSTVRKGSSGTDVIILQSILNSLGYDCGGADGKFGSKTLKAVKKFQKDKGLTVDGIVGKNTWTALSQAAHLTK